MDNKDEIVSRLVDFIRNHDFLEKGNIKLCLLEIKDFLN